MSVDKLQKAIRKLKNPSMIAFSADDTHIPPEYDDYGSYAKDLLIALKDLVPAVRFDFASFVVLGTEGVAMLSELLSFAKVQGFYVLLDTPEIWTPRQAELVSDGLMAKESNWNFDGLLLSCYLGSDGMRPFADRLKENDKDLFILLRTANKSASELQELLTGSRLVYTAAADITKRLGEGLVGRSGYSRIAGVGPATSADALLSLRSKYPAMFLLIDGFDYSGANAKNCARAFDQLGHGAIACAGSYVTAAWQEASGAEESAVQSAVAAAERMKKNLNRYVTVL